MEPSPVAPPFKLLQHFSVASLIAIVAATITLALVYERVAVRDLVEREEQHHVALTQVAANTLRERIVALLQASPGLDAAALKSHPVTRALRESVLAELAGTQVLKVKIFDVQGRTVFSTEALQIGEDKSGNEGFRSALAGRPISELTRRDQFSAFEQQVENVDVLSSYVPVYAPRGKQAIAVFEIYSDLSALLARIRETRRSVVLAVSGVLMLLYAVLFLVVRRAQAILRRQESEIRRLALHDRLTGLANAELFMHLLAADVAKTVRRGDCAAVLFLDLDGFKAVNDSLGHAAGDELLKEVAARIRTALRAGDAVSRDASPSGISIARLGGDEFTVVLPGLARPDDAAIVARRLLHRVSQPYAVGGRNVVVTASIGVALCPRDGSSPDALLRSADAAMYEAKKLGRNTYCFHASAAAGVPVAG